MPDADPRQMLIEDLAFEVARYQKLGRTNHLAAFSLTLITVLASVAAGALGLFEVVPSQLVGVVALVPAGAALVSRELKLQPKANHYYRWAARFREIRGRARFSAEPNDNTGHLSWQREQANLEMTAEWEQQFGSSDHRGPPREDHRGFQGQAH